MSETEIENSQVGNTSSRMSDASAKSPITKSPITKSPITKSPVKGSIELGDVIKLSAPSNSEIHDQIYYVYYIDQDHMKLMNVSSKVLHSIKHSNYLADESIVAIDLLFRNPESGFARQNNLVPGKWLNIHFGGDMPSVLSGEITNLEEDMIEVTTYPGYEAIYIDFAYCGLPEDLPIDKIVVADRPAALANRSLLESMPDHADEWSREEAEQATAEYDTNGEFILHIPESVASAPTPTLDAIVEERIDADAPVPRESAVDDDDDAVAADRTVLGQMTVLMEVRESERRYSIEAQLSDLIGQLVSRIPVEDRTPQALGHAHLLVSRYKDIRNSFSTFDDMNNVVSAKTTNLLHKPVIDRLVRMDTNVGWMVPVVFEPRTLIYIVDIPLFSDRVKCQDDYGEPDPMEFNMTELSNLAAVGGDGTPLYDDIAAIDSLPYSADHNRYDEYLRAINRTVGAAPFASVQSSAFVPESMKLMAQPVRSNIDVVLDVSPDNKFVSYASSPIDHVKGNQRGARKFVMRKYMTGDTRLYSKTGHSGQNAKLFVRRPAIAADTAVVRSFLSMPQSVMLYNQTRCASSSIFLKSKLARQPPYLFRMLKALSQIDHTEIDSLQNEINYSDVPNPSAVAVSDDWAEAKGAPFLDRITHFTLAENARLPGLAGDDLTQQFLNTIIPRTRTILRWMRPQFAHLYNYNDIVRTLEPFFIDESDITFKQYLEVRYYIKEKLKKYYADLAKKSQEYKSVRHSAFREFKLQSTAINRIPQMLKDDKTIMNIFCQAYDLGAHITALELARDDDDQFEGGGGVSSGGVSSGGVSSGGVSSGGGRWNSDEDKLSECQSRMKNQLTSSELMAVIDAVDGGMLFAKLVQYSMFHLVAPKEILEKLDAESIDTSDKDATCSRRYIVKKYGSMAELQKDNGTNDDLYFDKEFDDTPYHIVGLYKSEKKRFAEPKEFAEFLQEKLIQKHDCPPAMAPDLARTLILGKKQVEDGEYAILHVVPKYVASPTDVDRLSEKAKREMIAESVARATTQYFRRIKGQWVGDAAATEDSFIDNNTLFCNLAATCTKLKPGNQCLPNVSAAVHMKLAQRDKMMDEFDLRAAKTAAQIKQEMQTDTMRLFHTIRKNSNLAFSKQFQQNFYAYNLGKYVSRANEESVKSPHAAMISRILGHPDFAAKQYMLTKFCDQFCTKAIRGYSVHWLYCRDTNIPLVPLSLFLLARAHETGNYATTLDIICRVNGTLSDDGDSIVDKHSGYVLRKIDYAPDEEMDDRGFVGRKADIVEKDMYAKVQETLAKKDRVFHDPTAQTIYNVYSAISVSVGITDEVASKNIEEFVMRISLECMNDAKIVIGSEREYVAKMLRKNKAGNNDAGKPEVASKYPPYITYRNQTLITLVACAMLISVQTLIPSFRTKTYFPGCIRSFDGYPLDPNSENLASIKYLACIMDKMKRNSAQPWKSIEPLSVDSLGKRMKMVMAEYLVKRADVNVLYANKRDYARLNPAESAVPDEVALSRWVLFLPPLVPFSLEKPAAGITAEFEKDLFHAMSKGAADQTASLGVLRGKLIRHAYAVFELVQAVVQSKKALLGTSGGTAFLENNCCNEPGKPANPLAYFNAENNSLEVYLKKIIKMTHIVRQVQFLSRAPMFYCPDPMRIGYQPAPENVIEDTIYLAYMHYCFFDKDEPIPKDLESVCSEKPKYDRSSGLRDKIQFMKQHGKTYGLGHFRALMDVVNRRNVVRKMAYSLESAHNIGGFEDVLTYFEMDNPSHMIEPNLVRLIKATLGAFDGRTLHADEPAAERRLKSYLLRVNRDIEAKLATFITSNSVVYTQPDLAKVLDYVANIDNWAYSASVHDIGQQVRNSIHRIGRVNPGIIASDCDRYRTKIFPMHWGFDTRHVLDLTEIMDKMHKTYLRPHCDTTDAVFNGMMRRIMRNSRDLTMFVDQIPCFDPVVLPDGREAFYLHDTATTKMLLRYCWLSVAYEYLVAVYDQESQAAQTREAAQTRRQRDIADADDIFGQSDDDDDDDDAGSTAFFPDRTAVSELELGRAQPQRGTTEDNLLRKKTATTIFDMIRMETLLKQRIGLDYRQIMEKNTRLKNADKKHITDYLAHLTTDARRVEQDLRKHKLGRWNVGQQKSLFKYSKTAYSTEADLMEQQQRDIVDDDVVYSAEPAMLSPEDIDRIDAGDADREADREANDFSDLAEDHRDGNYYRDDYDDDEDGY